MTRTISGSCQGVAPSLYGVFPVPLGQLGDVSEVNGRETPYSHLRLDHVSRNALAVWNKEAKGLGNADKR